MVSTFVFVSIPLTFYFRNRYCERINALLQQGSDEWQTVWKAAMPELSNLQANEISMINSLLKPVESAFKVLHLFIVLCIR